MNLMIFHDYTTNMLQWFICENEKHTFRHYLIQSLYAICSSSRRHELIPIWHVCKENIRLNDHDLFILTTT